MYVYIVKFFFFSLKPEGSGYRPTSAIYMVGILGQVVCILQAEVFMTHRVSSLCLPNPNTTWGVLFPCLFYRREEPGRVGPDSNLSQSHPKPVFFLALTVSW